MMTQDSHVSSCLVLYWFTEARRLFPGVPGSIHGSVQVRRQICKLNLGSFFSLTPINSTATQLIVFSAVPTIVAAKVASIVVQVRKGSRMICWCVWSLFDHTQFIVAFHTSPSTWHIKYLFVCVFTFTKNIVHLRKGESGPYLSPVLKALLIDI